MGSGRAGAGGIGGGGSGGSGRGTTLKLERIPFGLKSSKKPNPKSKVEKEVQRVISHLPKEYLAKQFGSPMARATYEQLFNLNVNVFQNKSWGGIKDRYGIVGDGGCLRNWAAAVNVRHEMEEPDFKVREMVRDTLETFLLRASNDPNLYFKGPSDQIIAKLNQKVFDRTSNNFLGIMIKPKSTGKGEM
jgi:hypothetical protein